MNSIYSAAKEPQERLSVSQMNANKTLVISNSNMMIIYSRALVNDARSIAQSTGSHKVTCYFSTQIMGSLEQFTLDGH